MTGIIVSVLLMFCVSAGQQQEAPKQQGSKWESAIVDFEAWDAKNSVPKDAVLFVGSSSIRMWNTAKLFPEYPVINRGFGGAMISDVNLFVGRIVLPYKPKIIVFYCGGNDLFGAAKTPRQVFDDYRQFVSTVQADLPEVRILFLSLRPGPAWWPRHNLSDEFSRLVKEFSNQGKNLYYADMTTGMFNAKGEPDPADYQDDGIHLNDKSNIKWAKLLAPILKRIYNGDVEARQSVSSPK
jgi:lysophospholipase L1-like esterase